MSDYLVIVESPAKARTIERYLGKNYTVKASMGHVRDLPRSQMGVDVENNFTPKYITIRGKGDVLKELRQAAKKAKKIRSEEHTSELQSRGHLVCRLLLEKKKKTMHNVADVVE